MLADLPAPVGELGHLAAQAHERVRRARHGWPRSTRGSPRACGRHQIVRSGCSDVTVSLDPLRLVDRHVGVGGRPRLNAREARKPASAPSRNSTPATMKKPQKYVVDGENSAYHASHAKPFRRKSRPTTKKTPAAIPTTAPRGEHGRLLAHLGLGELDLLVDEDLRALGDLLDRLADLLRRPARLLRARSPRCDGHAVPPRRLRMIAATSPPANAAPTRISGRSAGCRTGGGSASAAVPGGGSAASAVPTVGWLRRRPGGRRAVRSSVIRAGPPRRRGAISPRPAFVVATEASAPIPASRPDHIRRLTRSLCPSARQPTQAVAGRRSSPPQIVSTM